MTIYDGVMAAVLIAGMIRGAWRGITWQLASIASLVLGYLFSYPISGAIASRLPGTPEAARAMAMAGAYAAVSGAVFAGAWMVRNVIRRMKFEAFDRHLGMMLGAVEGVAVGILGTMLVVSVAPSSRTPIFTSPTGKVVNAIVSHVGPILPSEVRSALAPYWPKAEARALAAGSSGPAGEASAGLPPADRAELVVRTRERLDAEVGLASDSASPPPSPEPSAPAPAPSAREVMGQLVDQGKRRAEQALAETLDVDGEAATIRDLIQKDRDRLQEAVAGAVDKTRANLSGQVGEVVEQTKKNLVEQVQGRAGQVQGPVGDAQKKLGQYRARLAQAQDDVQRTRQRLERGVDGAIEGGRQKVEKSIFDAIDQGLDKLGLPDAPAAPPARPAAGAPR